MLENSDSSPSLVQAKALVELRDSLIVTLHESGVKPAELSYVFNIQRQLINHVINKHTDIKQTRNKQN